MNFLAHAYLAGPAPADRLGGMLGDFVKGPLPAGLPAPVAAGVSLHRRIDSFADAHPAFRASRSRVSAERRRYAGVMVDLFYDHFLARHWDQFSAEPLQDFTAGTYALLAVLAGCPLDGNGHWYEAEDAKGPRWNGETYQAWLDLKDSEAAKRVRSMSGYTRIMMGEPTLEWLSSRPR